MSWADRLVPLEERIARKLAIAGECRVWTGSTCGRDHRPSIHGGYVHRIVWELAHGPIPNDLRVLHRCDNPRCLRTSHLFLGTQQDNIRDMIQKGRKRCASGESHPSAKVTDAQVREICDLFTREHIPKRELARRYGVSPPAIRNILNRQLQREAS